jgi:hypothetical protein
MYMQVGFADLIDHDTLLAAIGRLPIGIVYSKEDTASMRSERDRDVKFPLTRQRESSGCLL